jgi:hypothetical protein
MVSPFFILILRVASYSFPFKFKLVKAFVEKVEKTDSLAIIESNSVFLLLIGEMTSVSFMIAFLLLHEKNTAQRINNKNLFKIFLFINGI